MSNKTLFNSDHLPILKKQLHTIFDQLTFAEIIQGNATEKNTWLSICAQAVGYGDWDDLKAQAVTHHEPTHNILFNQASIIPFIQSVRVSLGEHIDNIEGFTHVILRNLTTEELNAMNGNKEELPPLPKAPTSYTLELGPNTAYARDLLDWLWPRTKNHQVDPINTQYLAHMKEKRMSLSKSQAKERAFDVYPHSGMLIRDILEQLISENYLELNDDQRCVTFTRKGLNYLNGKMTHEYDDQWKEWFKAFAAHLKKIPYRYIKIDWTPYIDLYARGMSPIEAAKSLEWSECYTQAHSEIQSAIKHQLDIHLPLYPKERYLQFTPRIFLTPELTSNKVTDIHFEFIGPDWAKPNGNPKTKRFWPNKRYVSVYLDTSPKSRGWYAVIPDEVDCFQVSYKWTSQSHSFASVTHHMTYQLEPNIECAQDWLYGNECMKHSDSSKLAMAADEYSFNHLECLTHGKHLTKEEIVALDRFKAGITSIHIDENGVIIHEERTLTASNSFACVGIIL
ncbi:hypothetical protein Q8W41_25860 [Vibrio splendidus]|uniref:hypothetical protein n=1 Tax=Vibrio splendidus TaxID=29497 RepID=UPI00273247BF|nr:hypothetical protein [Vibrio splendidus]MDP2592899.1 hypothetical protein [Vibrio splendidus]